MVFRRDGFLGSGLLSPDQPPLLHPAVFTFLGTVLTQLVSLALCLFDLRFHVAKAGLAFTV